MEKDEIRQIIRDYLQSGAPEVRNIVKDIIEKDPKFIFQNDIFPDTIKSRMISEGVRYLRSGVVADRPTEGEQEGATFYATDEDKLYMWDGDSWNEVSPAQDLSSYVTLTGTQTLTNKTLTADSNTIYPANNIVARAYLASDQLNITNDTATKVSLETDSFDPNNIFDTTDKRFEIATAGYYIVSGSIYWDSLVADKNYQSEIRVNAGQISVGRYHSALATGLITTVTDIVNLAASDYVELYGHHGAGVNTVDIISGSSATYMSLALIST